MGCLHPHYIAGRSDTALRSIGKMLIYSGKLHFFVMQSARTFANARGKLRIHRFFTSFRMTMPYLPLSQALFFEFLEALKSKIQGIKS